MLVSTQGNATAVSVNSTNPNATMYDKNDELPKFNHDSVPATGKFVNGQESAKVSVGDTVTYTITFQAANYNGKGENAQLIRTYTVSDTLPKWLENVTIQSVQYSEKANEDGTYTYTNMPTSDYNATDFATNKTITFSWLNDGVPKYDNGTLVTITYTAKVGVGAEDQTITYGTDGNVNTATLAWTDVTNGNGSLESKATIYTYEFDLVKTGPSAKDADNNDTGVYTLLSGAKFKLFTDEACTKGITLDTNNVVSNASENAEATEFEVTDGKITVKGLKDGTYYLQETVAPAGYNKMAGTKELTITDNNLTATGLSGQTYTSTTETNGGGVHIINNSGTELPSTGGIGTTIFYVIGGILVIGAGVLLVPRSAWPITTNT